MSDLDKIEPFILTLVALFLLMDILTDPPEE
jgi:hypothetical protein